MPGVEVKDTLGAGDVLHGAFAWAVAAGRHDLADDPADGLAGRLARAAAVASQRCTFAGIGPWREHLAGRPGQS